METEKLYSRVSPPWWDEVWIVAGGPSARAFDFDRLTRKDCILVNDAHLLLTARQARNCNSCLFSADADWVRRNKPLLKYRRGEHFVCVPLDSHSEIADIEGVTCLQRAHFSGLSDEPTHLCGTNSGYAALNLAYLKRAQMVHLVGYDMDPKAHGKGDQYARWAAEFRDALPQLEQAGVRVVNHNRGSAIDAFPKED